MSAQVILLATLSILRVHELNGQPCYCDRIASVCDVGCRCDSVCSSVDKLAFSDDLNKASGTGHNVCISTAWLFQHNSAFRLSAKDANYHCFTDANYAKSNYYNPPTIALSPPETLSLRRAYVTQSLENPSASHTAVGERLTPGKPIQVFLPSRMLGWFEVPIADSQGYCHSQAYPEFLVNFTSSCQRLLVINDQGASCLSLPTLKTFTEGIRIPLLSLAAANEDANGTLAARFMPFKEVNCQDELKISQPCPVGPPTFSGSAGTCSSVVTSIIYIFGYNQTGLTRAYVNATVEHNLTSTFKQKFTVLFLEDANFQLPSSVVLTQPDPTDYYSGAPGYRVRYPVRSGVYQGTGKIQMHPIPETNPDQAGGRQYGWWAVPAGGEFTALQTFSVPTATIRFGVDLTTVCLLRYTGNISGNGAVSQCQQLSDRITAVLNTNYTPPTHVASWGNLSVHSLKEWIPVTVIETNPGNITAGYRSCHKVVLGQTIRIVYTRNGSLDNPQNRILAVQRYLHRGSVQFQCGGRFCTPNNPDLQQTKPIVTVVKFVDATITPNDRIRESANQYGDIFYPFYVDDAASVMED